MLWNKLAKHRARMDQAKNYEQWKEAALELDYLEGNVEWKEAFSSPLYNYKLIYDRLTEIRSFQTQKNNFDLIRSLREGLHHDLGNMGDARLYGRSHVGTKHLIEEYVNQVCSSLNYVCNTSIPELPLDDKIKFFKDTLLSFGRPALLLSGGATLGMFHIGVVKALWERGLLPSVIAGSSVGSVMAAMLGTHSDAELPNMLDPDNHNLNAWKWNGILKGFAGKGFMDARQLRDCLRSNIGEFTFQEAYEKSGRSINITVSPVHQHQKPRLLSRFTSPYLLVWSGAQASCSVPGIFPPTKLVKKDREGELVPYMPRLRWVDGSVVDDLPIERLMHLHDVNFSIVSQTNPHIVPFMRLNDMEKKRSLLSLPSRLIKAEIGFHGKALFDVLRKTSSPELMRQVSGQIYTILAQKYYGDVTIAPHYTLKHYANMLSNPSVEFVRELTLAGERATWPKLAMIRTHAKISRTLERCVQQLESRRPQNRRSLKVIPIQKAKNAS